MCYSPQSIPRKDGNGSADRITVPCGKCLECLSTRRAHWSFRLEEELKVSSTAYFLTLTYDDESVPLIELDDGSIVPTVVKSDLQNFIKRLRKFYYGSKRSSIRYYAVSEYGSRTQRPHYHCIIYNVPVGRLQFGEDVQSIWKSGFVDVGSVTEASIQYVTKYVINRDFELPIGYTRPFSLMSKGLGKSYVDKWSDWHHASPDRWHSVRPNGVKISLPRYYVDKLFSDVEREHHYSLVKSKLVVDQLQKQEDFEISNPGVNYYRNEIDRINGNINRFHRRSNSKSKF